MLRDSIANLKQKKNFSLLMVEDEIMVSKPMKKVLEYLCNDVVVADDGVQGWELYQQRPFSLVLTDLQMPNMNGAELIEKIRAVDPEKIIIVITAFREGKEYEKAQELGADFILKKPFSVQSVIEIFNTLDI